MTMILCKLTSRDAPPGMFTPRCEGTYFAPPQASSLIDDLWHRALENYGLQRPTDVTGIHVFRVILQSSWDKNAVYSDGYQNGSYG